MTTSYALKKIEDKGPLFVGPNTPTYEGMIIGEHVLESDLEMNACRKKELTNIRVSGMTASEDKLHPPRLMSLEEMIAYIR
jgi:GTP-binding protein